MRPVAVGHRRVACPAIALTETEVALIRETLLAGIEPRIERGHGHCLTLAVVFDNLGLRGAHVVNRISARTALVAEKFVATARGVGFLPADAIGVEIGLGVRQVAQKRRLHAVVVEGRGGLLADLPARADIGCVADGVGERGADNRGLGVVGIVAAHDDAELPRGVGACEGGRMRREIGKNMRRGEAKLFGAAVDPAGFRPTDPLVGHHSVVPGLVRELEVDALEFVRPRRCDAAFLIAQIRPGLGGDVGGVGGVDRRGEELHEHRPFLLRREGRDVEPRPHARRGAVAGPQGVVEKERQGDVRGAADGLVPVHDDGIVAIRGKQGLHRRGVEQNAHRAHHALAARGGLALEELFLHPRTWDEELRGLFGRVATEEADVVDPEFPFAVPGDDRVIVVEVGGGRLGRRGEGEAVEFPVSIHGKALRDGSVHDSEGERDFRGVHALLASPDLVAVGLSRFEASVPLRLAVVLLRIEDEGAADTVVAGGGAGNLKTGFACKAHFSRNGSRMRDKRDMRQRGLEGTPEEFCGILPHARVRPMFVDLQDLFVEVQVVADVEGGRARGEVDALGLIGQRLAAAVHAVADDARGGAGAPGEAHAAVARRGGDVLRRGGLCGGGGGRPARVVHEEFPRVASVARRDADLEAGLCRGGGRSAIENARGRIEGEPCEGGDGVSVLVEEAPCDRAGCARDIEMVFVPAAGGDGERFEIVQVSEADARTARKARQRRGGDFRAVGKGCLVRGAVIGLAVADRCHDVVVFRAVIDKAAIGETEVHPRSGADGGARVALAVPAAEGEVRRDDRQRARAHELVLRGVVKLHVVVGVSGLDRQGVSRGVLQPVDAEVRPVEVARRDELPVRHSAPVLRLGPLVAAGIGSAGRHPVAYADVAGLESRAPNEVAGGVFRPARVSHFVDADRRRIVRA